MSHEDGRRLARSFRKVLDDVVCNPTAPVKDYSVVSTLDIQRNLKAYKLLPPLAESCTHWLIERHIQQRPEEQAVASWDRNLTYKEMGSFAFRLAKTLEQRNIGPETVVALCFPKSSWAVVSMVAVQMAGGAFVPLDPHAPQSRIRAMLQDVGAKLCLCSAEYESLIKESGVASLRVSEESLLAMPLPASAPISSVTPKNLCYVIFTSGSTGKPKGIMLQHDSICTTSEGYGKQTNIGPGTRVLQFSAYTFDIGVLDVLVTLMRGGCVCVISDQERLHDLAGGIARTRANWMFLTPTVSDLVSPSMVPTIKTLSLGGEAINQASADRWGRVQQLYGLYGPAEASGWCAWNPSLRDSKTSTNIGDPLSSVFWVVDPASADRLVPDGCVGELMLQGPLLGRGYIAADEQSLNNWIEDAKLLPRGIPPVRAYLTGDLVRRNADGTIEYVGRKDSQVKINGQRTEISGIECVLSEYLPCEMRGIVDLLSLEDGARDTLVALLWYTSGSKLSHSAPQICFDPSDDERQQIEKLDSMLRTEIPSYMVPSRYFILYGQPQRTTSDKISRKELGSLARKAGMAGLLGLQPCSKEPEMPSTPIEFQIQRLWCKVLGVPRQKIGRNDNFLRIGGDSLAAIKLSSEARANGINLSVETIFSNPKLADMARMVTPDTTPLENKTLPFELIPSEFNIPTLKQQIQELCQLPSPGLIEDIYPSATLQEGLMALSAKSPGSYVAKNIYRLARGADIHQFKAAWEKTVEACDILRTRIVVVDNIITFQVVVSEKVCWNYSTKANLRSVVAGLDDTSFGYGSSLCSYTLHFEENDVYFIWLCHHALFDSWTMTIIMEILRAFYSQVEQPKLQPYSTFIRHIVNKDMSAAEEYWKEQLQGAPKADFPIRSYAATMGTNSYTTTNAVTKTSISLPDPVGTPITKASIFRAAWAVVLGKYCNTNDICFGATVSGRYTSIAGVDRIAGPMIASVPVRIAIDLGIGTSDFLQAVQDQASEMAKFEQFGLQNISKLGREFAEACDFASLLVVNFTGTGETLRNLFGILESSEIEKSVSEDAMKNYFNYPLVLQASIGQDDVELVFVYDEAFVSDAQCLALSSHLEQVANQLLAEKDSLLGSITVSGPWDLQQACDWNRNEISVVPNCLTVMFLDKVAQIPDNEALFSSEGSMTYAELNTATDALACYLQSLDLPRKSVIAICFEASKFAVISMLAILKAGHAFMPIDPLHPIHRRQQLVSEVDAEVLLASSLSARSCQGIAKFVLEVSGNFLRSIRDNIHEAGVQHKPLPTDAAYILFTSGSTGRPKGVVVEHSAICSSITSHGRRYNLGITSRVLQFSSYVFDASICEIFTTLAFGGVACILPHTQKLQNAPQFITSARVNTAFLTPSFVSTFTYEKVPTLEVLVLGGEAPTPDIITKWQGRVKLINGYGPTECCVYCTSYTYQAGDSNPRTIGTGHHGFCWIVDPNDYDTLAPIGCIGELVIQSHALARGYYNDMSRSTSVFPGEPKWLPESARNPMLRFYKTGDLVRYNFKGEVEYIGRKDTQVKLRGQRLEIGEVEHSIRAADDLLSHAAVQFCSRATGDFLIAFLTFPTIESGPVENSLESLLIDRNSWTASQRDRMATIKAYLQDTLPAYMIPSVFIPLSAMPFVSSMKIDRRKLKALTDSLSLERLTEFSMADRKLAPTTDMEFKIRALWSEVLRIDPDHIGKEDSFLEVGGDSISAIQLSSAARRKGLDIPAPAIFKSPRLMDMALNTNLVPAASTKGEQVVKPFSLLGSAHVEDTIRKLREACRLQENEVIEDAYPCTPLQEGLLALSIKHPHSYIAKHVYRLHDHIDLELLKASWKLIYDNCDSQRLRIVQIGNVSLQVLVGGDFVWEHTIGHNLQSYLHVAQTMEMTYGSRLCRSAMIQDENGASYLIWIIHHAVVDGWTMKLILRSLKSAYEEGSAPRFNPFSWFIQYASNLDKSRLYEYWTKELHGARAASFPPLASATKTSRLEKVTRILTRDISFPSRINSSITKGTILRAAWAMLLSRYSGMDDLCFAVTASGRNAPLSGIENIAGPVIGTVPIRVKIDPKQDLVDFLGQVQSQALAMMPYEQMGFQNIAKLGEDAKKACELSSLLIVQPEQQVGDILSAASSIMDREKDDKYAVAETFEGYFTFPVVIQCMMFENHVMVHLTYDSSIVSDWQMNCLSVHYDNIVQQMAELGEQQIADVSVAGPWDLSQAISFNNHMKDVTVNSCVHELISQRAAESPESEAIFSRDICMTYHDLDTKSDLLAAYLGTNGLQSEDVVAICFEKSAWAIVAMLAVMKSGGVFMPLDSSHPFARSQGLVQQVNARYVIGSPTTERICSRLSSKSITLSDSFIRGLTGRRPVKENYIKPYPTNAAYILFTSGSTGQPKGITVNHSAICSSIISHGNEFKLSRSSRVLQFASYVFDVSFSEILTTLVFGGTVCVVSNEERLQGISGFINDSNTNVAMLTPSFTTTFTPAQVPSLKTLILGGEAPRKDNLTTWLPHVRLLNGYAPAECCIYALTHSYSSVSETPTILGKTLHMNAWIVEPDDRNRLAPIGCVGELLLHGFTMGRGYVNDEERTSESFLASGAVSWLPDSLRHPDYRIYKSGDLVRYTSDGDIEYIGRKDTQVKLRGQRIELGEIEYNIKQSSANTNIEHVAVEVLRQGASEALIAFASFHDTPIQNCGADVNDGIQHLAMDTVLQARFDVLRGQLSKSLPAYMVPSFFMPVARMPFLSSMKIDRRKLLEYVQRMNPHQLKALSRSQTESLEPDTDMEIKLRNLWAVVLKVPSENIGKGDQFLQIGGDSISAIQLSTLALENGIKIDVSSVFEDSKLSSMAAAASLATCNNTNTPVPFALLPRADIDNIIATVQQKCSLKSVADIEDIYPCTKLQEGLMALSLRQPGSYLSTSTYRLPQHVNISRFMVAWQQTVQQCSNLRTRIVVVDNNTFPYHTQAVIKQAFQWPDTTGLNLDSYLKSLNEVGMGYGKPLCHSALVRDGGEYYFVWKVHHAIYDGWSANLALQLLHQHYNQTSSITLQPYVRFIEYIVNLDSEASPQYWTYQLRGARKPSFPAVGKVIKPAIPNMHIVKDNFAMPRRKKSTITKASTIRAAWAIVLARYSDTKDVCFGATFAGRSAPVSGLATMVGPVIATVPIRCQLPEDMRVSEFLERVQRQGSEITPHEQFGLQNIAKLGDEAREVCDFSSLLVIQPERLLSYGGQILLEDFGPKSQGAVPEQDRQQYFNYPLVIVCNLQDNDVIIDIYYDMNIISKQQATTLCHHLDNVTQQLQGEEDRTLGELTLAGKWDVQHAINSQHIKPARTSCTHWMIQKQISQQPDATAVASWDGDLTYSELGVSASRLVPVLRQMGVGNETIVPICFPKSKWAIIAMVAVQMAGGAFVHIDPATSLEFLKFMLSETRASLVLTSTLTNERFLGLVDDTLIIDDNSATTFTSTGSSIANYEPTSPENASYVFFTQDSSGPSKGIVMEHQAVCSSSEAYGATLGVGPGTRVFQFSPFSSHVGILDVLVTLMRGGCICIAAEQDCKSNLPTAIHETHANWAFLTPTAADLISPKEVPHLRVMVLGGEAITEKTIHRWKDILELYSMYGPPEAPVCSWNANLGKNGNLANIGQPLASAFWVVEPTGNPRLSALGCVGELVIEGPLLARGYIICHTSEDNQFVEQVDWLPGQGSSRKVFRTGDLVRRNHDGSFDYIRRKDEQIESQDLSVELEEIDHHMNMSLPSNMAGMTAILKDDYSRRESLTALLWYISGVNHSPSPLCIVQNINEEMISLISESRSSMSAKLPKSMVPDLYLIFHGTPERLQSGKVDRNQLITKAQAASTEDKLRFNNYMNNRDAPVSVIEKELQSIWSSILSIPSESIGRSDNFLQLGGDSISAIQLSSLAGSRNMALTVDTIFRQPKLSDMADWLAAQKQETSQTYSPFSALDSINATEAVDIALKQCKLKDRTAIEDVFQCTKLQEGLMALSLKTSGSYVARHILRVADDVDIGWFKTAWEMTFQSIEILRSRIILINNSAFQVIVKENLHWNDSEAAGSERKKNQSPISSMTYGSPLVEFELTSDRRFVWTIHHALFDGFSLAMIVNTFVSTYLKTQTGNFGSFGKFISFTRGLDSKASSDYWANELQGAKRSTFPDVASANSEQVKQSSSIQRSMAFSKFNNSTITQATVFRAAWAIVLARYSDTKDICFGATVSGRQAPVPGIESIAGPTIATVPVRIDTGASISVPGFLQKVQAQAVEMVPFEQFGLQNISRLHSEAKEACRFSSLITIQPMKQFTKSELSIDQFMTPEDEDGFDVDGMSSTYFTYPLVVQVKILDGKVVFDATFQPEMVSESQVERLLRHFEHVALQLSRQEDVPLQNISVASLWDLQQAIEWNKEDVSPVEVLLHDLIARQAASNPSKEALFSTGRIICYGELDELSTKLAHHLTSLGVGIETIVPFCFEKSIWAVVSILGILKAGGAMMPLDPAHPVKHRQNLVNKANAKVVLVSPSTKMLCAEMTTHVIQISEESPIFHNHQLDSTEGLPRPTPANAANVIFSSGSTGTPKGIVVEHRAFAASIRGHAKRFGMDHNSRVMQFSSYVFDVSVSDILSTLVLGGTICVPREEERLQGTAQFIEEARANFTLMPPSFLRTLAPEQVPSLKTLLVGGEALTNEIVERWAEKVKLINAYGPAEASVYSVSHTFKSSKERGATIGRGVSNFAWVTEVDDHDKLAPIGCVGELVLQGPAIARGYLDEAAKTEELFLNTLGCLPADIIKKAPRFYRTGDLVQYDSNGQLVYLGRRDTQVKVRGQRVDLGDIEYQMKRNGPQIEHAVVDLIKRPSMEALVALVSFKDDEQRQKMGRANIDTVNSLTRAFLGQLSKKLEACLPVHMIPSYFIPIKYMPRTGSGKIDRKVLREQGQELSTEEFVKFAINQRPEFCDCRNEVEFQVRRLWAEVLDYAEQLIGVHDDFYDLGGDSIRIVSLTRRLLSEFNVQIGLSMLNSKNTTIAAMASLINKTHELSNSEIEPPNEPTINLAEEMSQIISTLHPTIKEYPVRPPSVHPQRQETVLLTGSTGYLGTQLLKHLLRSPKVRSVVALVRALTPQHGLERVTKTARIAGWWHDQWLDKLEIWTGDLEASGLGLGADPWERLLGQSRTGSNITAIVHNGAVVNWNADYNRLRGANVQSTVELLRASLKSPIRPTFVFVSGGMKVDIEADRSATSESMRQNIGYVQSKFVAESVVYDTAGQLTHGQSRVSVIKPGIIIGNSSEGVANVDDFIWRLVSAASMLRLYPVEPDGSWISLADVDTVSSAVIEQVFAGDVAPFVDLTEGISNNRFWQLVNSELEVACEPVSWQIWRQKALEQMNAIGEAHPLWPVQHFLGGLGLSIETPTDTASSQKPDLAIKMNVKYLRRVGYLTCRNHATMMNGNEDVISRSTAANVKW